MAIVKAIVTAIGLFLGLVVIGYHIFNGTRK